MADSDETRDSDIATARGFYDGLLAFEDGMEGAAAILRNRGRWLEAIHHLQQARAALEHFIGERMTTDLRQAHDLEQLAHCTATAMEAEVADDTESAGEDA